MRTPQGANAPEHRQAAEPGPAAAATLHVMFILLPHYGHYNPTFKLARDLIQRGHRVTYVGIDGTMEVHVAAQGLPFVQLHGLRPEVERSGGRMTLSGLLQELRAERRLVDELVDGRLIADAMRRLQPDVILVDSTLTAVAVSLLRFGIPVLLLSSFLPLDGQPLRPPLDSWMGAGSGPIHRVRVGLAWAWRRVRRSAFNLLVSPFGLDHDRVLRRIGRAAGVDLRGRLVRNRLFGTGIDLPELVLCPEAFDLPSPHRPNLRFCDASILSGRRDGDADPEPASGSDPRPIVYVSLGTVESGSPAAFRALRAVLKAAEGLHHLRFVVASVPEGVRAELCVPPNASLHGYVPQLAWLSRASLFITHGGLGSIKEAILAGVPMIVLALPGADRYGNATRVEYHGLGRRIRADRATPAEVGSLIREVLSDTACRDQVAAMREAFLAAGRESPAAAILEQLVAAGSPQWTKDQL